MAVSARTVPMSDMPSLAEALPGLVSFAVGLAAFAVATVALLGIGVVTAALTEIHRYVRTHPNVR